MPPVLAFIAWLCLLLGLLRYDPAQDRKSSPALWLPLVWMVLMGSRSVSLWFGYATASSVTAALEEGNSLDHVVYIALIVLALRTLLARAVHWSDVSARNAALVAFLLFALLSVTWSDFALASFRRWTRELGSYVMILVVLTDERPFEAVETVLRRLSYLLIPISVVIIKYFPEIGITYSDWTGAQEFIGVATSKNMLGVLCMISGVFFFWDLMKRWPDRTLRRTRRVIVVDIAFIGMSSWLLNLADSATSRACLVIGCLIIMAVQSRWGKAHTGVLKILIPLLLVGSFVLDVLIDVSTSVSQLLGRDPTLTGRTEIWAALLSLKTNPIFGVGYESFWLGDRLLVVWQRTGLRGLNEAHNGYLETYLSLGLVGLCLLGGFIVATYRTICRRLSTSLRFSSLSIALWAILLIYNVTESAFKSGLLWFTFLLIGISVPRSVLHPKFSIADTTKARLKTAPQRV